MTNLVFSSAKSAEKNFKVSSLVTDNTANMVSALEILNIEFRFEGLTYECSAHILNLLPKYLGKTDAIKHITNILEFSVIIIFRKHSIMQKAEAH